MEPKKQFYGTSNKEITAEGTSFGLTNGLHAQVVQEIINCSDRRSR